MFIDAAAIEGLRVRRDALRQEMVETRSDVLAVPVVLSRGVMVAEPGVAGEDRAMRHPGSAFGFGRHLPLQTDEVVKSFVQDANRRVSAMLTTYGDQMTERRQKVLMGMVQVGDQIVDSMSGEKGRGRVRVGRTLGSYSK
ncbi:MAG: hypothetical protein K2X45_15840 [Phreatobacter sp.]|nr:hypothetical protein [Phreatobacter sp.]